MKITERARLDGGMYVMDAAPTVNRVRHRLPVARGACPYSRNPVRGWVQIAYHPAGKVLEG